VLLFTGKGGVGKTTVAAAAAVHAASAGLKTLVLSTDPAHSLSDVIGRPLTGRPTEVAASLFAQHVETRQRLDQAWGAIQRFALSLMDPTPVDVLVAEELTVLPGAEETAALLEVRDQVRSGGWDVVVVDCAPTAETLRLLALPEALSRYLSRAASRERRAARALRPMLGRALALPTPPEEVFDAASQLCADLVDVRKILTGSSCSVRLVMTPESVVVAESRRALTTLSLYGYRVDGVVVNRLIPDGDVNGWQRTRLTAQAKVLDEIGASFGQIPSVTAKLGAEEPTGMQPLCDLAAELWGDATSEAYRPASLPEPLAVERTADGFVLSFQLPFADRRDTDLMRRGDDLIVTIGQQRRIVALPGALRRCEVSGASMREGRLTVRFEPDPSQWSSR
jgi:arsenite-transporting ATPase